MSEATVRIEEMAKTLAMEEAMADEDEEEAVRYGTTYCYSCDEPQLRPILGLRAAVNPYVHEGYVHLRASLECGHEKVVVRPA